MMESKSLGRNFGNKHCKDCKEEEIKVEEQVKENLDMLDHDDFTHKLYGAIRDVVEEFKDKGLTHGDIASAFEFIDIHLDDEFNLDESLKEAKKESHYEEIEFFPGDEGDLDAEDYIKENGLEGVAYEWDDYRKGYVLYKESLEEAKEEEKKDDDKGDEDKKDSKEPKLETFDEQMDFLAADEQEAIDGYEKVLALVDDEHVKEQLQHIMDEEVAHKEFLEAVKSDKSLVYSHEDKEEKDEPKDDDIEIDANMEVVDDIDLDDFDDEFGVGESLEEDTVKKGDKWVNKGDEGTHGEFKTKKEADAQRKAMFANGYHEEVEEDFDDDFGDVHCDGDDCDLGVKVNWDDMDDEEEHDSKVCPKCHKDPCECLHEEEKVEEEHVKTGHIKLNKPVELKARDNH